MSRISVRSDLEKWVHRGFNPDCAVDTYCGLKSLAATLGFTILFFNIVITVPAV
jgi:hypothetical protein